MKQDKDFTNILNECLERLLIKGETVEQCLKPYPEQAAKLEPLLKTALAAKGATIQPRAEFKARARYQFHQALRELTAKKRPALVWFPRWATVIAIVFVLLLAGSSTMVAAGNSMPDSPLYPVKLATEEARLALTPSPMGKARLCAELADRRVAEIIYLADKGDFQQVELITQYLDRRLVMLRSLVLPEEGEAMLMMAPAPEEAGGKRGRGPGNNRAELRLNLELHAARHQALLEEVLKKAPESAKPALRRAMEVSATGYQKALEALDKP